MDVSFDAHLIRYGKHLIVHIPAPIVRDNHVCLGDYVRIRFAGIRSWEGQQSTVPRTIPPDSMVRDCRLDPDGLTWTGRVISSNGPAVRIPYELVAGRFLRGGILIRFRFLGFPDPPPSDHPS